jgi:predicted Zn finger-like uncharacterized protein
MNLATRCTECGTVFRVVQDQLKVSEGWVRCGRCTAVFNAQAHLFDLDAPPTPAQSATPPPDATWPASSTPAAAPSHDPDDWSPTMPVEDPIEMARHDVGAEAADFDEVLDVTAADHGASNAEVTDSDDILLLQPGATRDDDIAQPPMSTEGTPDVFVDIGERAAPAATAGLAAAPVHIDDDEAAVTPSFMRSGPTSSVLDRPAVRSGLMVAAIVLCLALAAQAMVAWRDQLAAQVPALRPVISALCQGLNCRISPLRRIDRLAVEASGLTRIEGAPLHRLSVTLRNRADTAVMAPALDLSVTDTQGKLVARKVLQLADLGVTSTTIEAGAEMPLQALLHTGERRVAGYTVELFYP